MNQAVWKWIALTSSALACAVACSGDDDPNDPTPAGAGGEAGASSPAAGSGGRVSDGGEAGASPSAPSDGGVAGGGGSPGLAGAGGNEAGSAAGGGAGAGGTGGAAGEGGAGGEGGAPPPNVVLDPDGTLRGTLEDGAATALYFWGADLPSSAQSAASSACAEACLAAWPVFHASPLVLAAGLDDGDFGELTRADGAKQTTFKGWPLYTYAAEVDATSRSGDGVDQLWHAVEQPFYSLVIMKSQQSPPQPAYLADGTGRTLYELLGDTAGTAGADPISTCTTTGCRRAWPAVSLATVKAVSSIGGVFDIFIRPEGQEIQLSYEGLPIYYYDKDVLPGDLLGVGKPSWVLALP